MKCYEDKVQLICAGERDINAQWVLLQSSEACSLPGTAWTQGCLSVYTWFYTGEIWYLCTFCTVEGIDYIMLRKHVMEKKSLIYILSSIALISLRHGRKPLTVPSWRICLCTRKTVRIYIWWRHDWMKEVIARAGFWECDQVPNYSNYVHLKLLKWSLTWVVGWLFTFH